MSFVFSEALWASKRHDIDSRIDSKIQVQNFAGVRLTMPSLPIFHTIDKRLHLFTREFNLFHLRFVYLRSRHRDIRDGAMQRTFRHRLPKGSAAPQCSNDCGKAGVTIIGDRGTLNGQVSEDSDAKSKSVWKRLLDQCAEIDSTLLQS